MLCPGTAGQLTGWNDGPARTLPTDAVARYALRQLETGMFGVTPGTPFPVNRAYILMPWAAVAICAPPAPQMPRTRPPTPLYVIVAVVPATSAVVETVGCAKSEYSMVSAQGDGHELAQARPSDDREHELLHESDGDERPEPD